jgi:hypothetical protein
MCAERTKAPAVSMPLVEMVATRTDRTRIDTPAGQGDDARHMPAHLFITSVHRASATL